MTKPSAGIHHSQSAEKLRRGRHLIYAINISLAAGVFLLGVKIYAWLLTGSVAIFSDAAESVVHFFIVCFAAFGVRLAQKPADRGHLYGHDRINFFSVGFEGAMIIVAALFIFYEAGARLLSGGLQLREVEAGIGYIALAAAINLALGFFLLRESRRWKSDVLDANGRHVLADSMTSFGVIAGLALAKFTGILAFDPAVAILVAAHILWSGAKLVRRAIGGLMDRADPETDAVLRAVLDAETQKYGAHYHFLRHRDAGGRLLVDFHLLFENETTVARAHDISMMIERAITRRIDMPSEITTHFEPLHGHDKAHRIKSIDGAGD
ncbi:MAG: cation transporter [Betaproteobacteria bacterium]|nr:cation transporter [Betaproteobacteria bacterium]